MDGDINLVADLEADQFQEGSVEDDTLRITDFRDGLRHGVILCLTEGKSKPDRHEEQELREYGFHAEDKRTVN